MKSGWAVAVVLGGPANTPAVLDRRRVEVSDPAVPRSRQPFHAGFGRAQGDKAVVGSLADPERITQPHIRALATA